MQEPTTVSELRSFLGMVNQLGKFILQLAERDKALRDLLSKKNCWMWGVNQANAFLDLKNTLTSPPIVAMYDPNRECKVSADARRYVLGGVLLQKWHKEWRPIAWKCLWTADTLSRAPVKRGVTPADKELFEDTNIYIDMVMENLPASTAYLEELKDQLQRDSVCARVMQSCTEGTKTCYTLNNEKFSKFSPSCMKDIKVWSSTESGCDSLCGGQGLSQQLNELVLNCRASARRDRRPAGSH
ncbi:hypothetical protein SRHO_G00143110 [Serrasalmus rhombeus]